MLTVMFVPQAAQGGSTLLSAMIYTPCPLITMALCAVLVFQPVQGFDWVWRCNWLKILLLAVLFAFSIMTLFTQSFQSFLYFRF